MAEEWLEEIYVHSQYVTKLKEIVRVCQVNNRFDALYRWEKSCDHLTELYNNSPVADDKVRLWIRKIFQLTPKATNCANVIDLIQTEVLPLIYYVISLYGHIDVSDGRRRILSSRAGYLTICDEQDGRYRYSATDPMEEAFDIAQKIYSPRNTEYHLWRDELGYLAYQIYMLSQRSARIHIYMTEMEMLDYGCHYGVLDWFAEGKLVLHYDPSAEEFLQNIDEKKNNYYISRPSMRFWQEREGNPLQRVYLNCRFWIDERKSLKINLECNLNRKKRLWRDMEADGYENTMVVAAGPSLDICIDSVRQYEGKIIAVGTVFRKLMQLGIVPDLVVITECDPIVYEQVEGLEDENIPLLLSPYVYWKIAQNYKGRIYFAQVAPSMDEREFSSEDPAEQFRIGGTVSLFAIEAAIHLGAEKIDLAGLDLAYPAEKTHAEGTSRNRTVSAEGLYKVPGVNGKMVYTDAAFDLYRQEIEALIHNNQQITFINHSPVGARIEGADHTGE